MTSKNCGVLDLEKVQRIMVLGAHPDDEIIGPGGTIRKLSEEGKKICVVTFTGGGTAANSLGEIEQMIAKRKGEMAESDKILGITSRELLQIPSQQVYGAFYGSQKIYDADATHKEITLHHKLIKLIRRYRPDIIFTHAPDNHRDHCAIAEITPQSVFQASESILEHLGSPWNVPVVLHYCVERELPPTHPSNVVIKIGEDNLSSKTKAMSAQLSQERGDYLQHFKEMIQGRAGLWGAKCFGAESYAEPFHLSDKIPIRIG